MAVVPETSLYQSLIRNIKALDDTSDLAAKTENFGTISITRAPTVDVFAAIEAGKSALGASLGEVQIYADVAFASQALTLPASVRLLKIFARSAFPGNSASNRVKAAIQNNRTLITIYTSSPGPDTFFALSWMGKSADYTLSFAGGGSAALDLSQGKDPVVKAPVAPPANNFEYMSIAERIMDNGQIQQVGLDRNNDHLPKLLNFQMLLAQSLLQTSPQVSYQLASYVATTSAKIAKGLDINSQASSFLATQISGDSSLARQQLVSDVDIGSASMILRSRLSAAQAFEEAFQAFRSQGVNASNTEVLANAALDNAELAATAYSFLADEAKKQYDAASVAHDIARERFQDLQKKLPDAQKAFQDGLEAWKQKQIATAVVEGVFALVLVVGSIAAAVVAPPAGVALFTASGGAMIGVIEPIKNATQEITKLTKVINTLKALYEKMKPGLEKIDKLVSSLKNTLELLKKFKKTGRAEDANLMTPDVAEPGDDAINMSAQWDVFAVDMRIAFEPLMAETIKGAPEFYALLQQMSVLGKAVLASQVALASAGSAYTTALTRSVLAGKEAENLRKAVGQLRGNPYALGVWQRAMFDHLCNVRSWVFTDLATFAESYRWFSLDDSSPVVLDPMKPIAALMNDAATIEARSVQAACSLRAQKARFVFDSSNNAGALVITGNIREPTFRFTLNARNDAFRPYYRVRVRSLLVRLKGATVANEYEPVTLTVKRAPAMVDLRKPIAVSDVIDTSGLADEQNNTHSLAAVIGKERTLGCSYMPRDGSVLVKGEMVGGSYGGTEMSSLFSEWSVAIKGNANVSGVTGITVEADCEVCVL